MFLMFSLDEHLICLRWPHLNDITFGNDAFGCSQLQHISLYDSIELLQKTFFYVEISRTASENFLLC